MREVEIQIKGRKSGGERESKLFQFFCARPDGLTHDAFASHCLAASLGRRHRRRRRHNLRLGASFLAYVSLSQGQNRCCLALNFNSSIIGDWLNAG